MPNLHFAFSIGLLIKPFKISSSKTVFDDVDNVGETNARTTIENDKILKKFIVSETSKTIFPQQIAEVVVNERKTFWFVKVTN